MSATTRTLVLAGLAGAALAGWWWVNSPERQIRRVLADVAEAIGHDMASYDLAGMASVARLQRHLAAEVVVEPGPPLDRLVGRDAVLAAAIRVRQSSGAVRVTFEDVRVIVGIDGRTADVSATAVARSTPSAGASRADARELALTMTLVDGRWVIASARAVPVLEPL